MFGVDHPPKKRTSRWRQEIPSWFCKGHWSDCGLVPSSFGRPSIHAVPSLRPYSPSCPDSQVHQSKVGLDLPHPGRRPPAPRVGVFSVGPGHSPLAYFGVNIQQGTSDQVAGCGAEDGRGVEDGWKGSRAVGDPLCPLRHHSGPPKTSPACISAPPPLSPGMNSFKLGFSLPSLHCV